MSELKIPGFKPNDDRVLVLADPVAKTTSGGIIIPDTVEEKPQSGILVALGEEVRVNQQILEHLIEVRKAIDPTFTSDFDIERSGSQVGDKVLFGKMAGMPMIIEGTEYLIMRYADIVGTII